MVSPMTLRTALLMALLAGLPGLAIAMTESASIASPDGRIRVELIVTEGIPAYRISRDGREIIGSSRLGFAFEGAAPLDRDLSIIGTSDRLVDGTWTQAWGEAMEIRDRHRELRVDLIEENDPGRRLSIVFRAFDDGVGFRYEIPEQPGVTDYAITDELTEFALAGDHLAWWIPAYHAERYEYLYRHTRLGEMCVGEVRAVHTPLTMETADGLHLSIHEAALVDYASMTLATTGAYTLKADLVPWSDGIRVRGTMPLRTPWRTIQIADEPAGLITSHLILNLNEPSVIEDTSWITPGKYVGIWWGMHLGIYTWGSGPTHGATTENTKRTIDFASRHGFSGVLVEGWNVGWDGNWAQNGEEFRFTTPHPDFDIDAVTAYAREKGVRLIGHHETGAGIANYERQLEDAFAFCRDHGINTVKTGYVAWGQGITRTDADGVEHREWHHGQWMVRHHQKVVEAAARYGIMLDVHEPVKDTGLRRTYPNLMTREGARGQEWNAWGADGGNPPEHTTILPFTRLLAGPMDFTPGIFDLLFEEARPGNRVRTTLAKQLALYVVLYSPLQMAADLPGNYEGQPAFRFIEGVPCDWRATQVPHARIGDYVTIVRQDRAGGDWYLGSITDENPRTLELPLDFLPPGRRYVAEIYADAADAHWRTNPLAIDIGESEVDHDTVMTLRLASGGGQAIRFRAVE